MKIYDIIFRYSLHLKQRDGICRVRTFINSDKKVFALITDIDKNTSASITNSIEYIYSGLIQKGLIPDNTTIIEHYESAFSSSSSTFDIVTFTNNMTPQWKSITKFNILELLECDTEELDELTSNNKRLISEIDRLRFEIDPSIDACYQEDSQIAARRIYIEDNMISKKDILSLIQTNAKELEFQKLLESDMSVLGEAYTIIKDEYICFSQFPIGNGYVDFAIFTGRSKMDVILIEIKGADFFLYNQGFYKKLNEKMNAAIDQINNRLRFIHDNIHEFVNYVHKTREKVESGENIYNSFMGPCKKLEVSKEKDINIQCIVIGGKTRDDLIESKKRHDYEEITRHQIKIESWETWIRRLKRN